jgi:hypothetical protein
MDTSNAEMPPATSRKPMPAEVFIKIWNGEIEGTEWGVKKWKGILDTKDTELERIVKLEEHYSGDAVMFENIEIVGEVQISNYSTLLPCLILTNSVIKNIYIENTQIHSIYICENTCVEEIKIIENSKIGYSLVSNSNIGTLKLKNSRITILRIEKKSKVGKLQLWHSLTQRIRITEGSFIEHIFCQFSHKEPTQLLLDNSNIGYLDFDDSVYPGFTTFNLSNCKVHTLVFSNFCNYGNVFFSDLKPLFEWGGTAVFRRGQKTILNTEPTLHLTDSDLGKMQFINCDLRQFKKFEFYNTKLLNVFVAASHMPDDKTFCLPNGEKNPAKIAQQKRLAYGQFKKIYEAQGDIAGSLQYLAYEMDAYREQLNLEKTQPRLSNTWWRKKQAWDNRAERVTLWLNKYSTGYGNNWLRGLCMTVLSMAICFTVFCWMLGFSIGNDWELFGKLISYAPQYLNLFRDLDSVAWIKEIKPQASIVWYARLWDFISRIIVAYFAYQTIQAFRKLGKSSG